MAHVQVFVWGGSAILLFSTPQTTCHLSVYVWNKNGFTPDLRPPTTRYRSSDRTPTIRSRPPVSWCHGTMFGGKKERERERHDVVCLFAFAISPLKYNCCNEIPTVVVAVGNKKQKQNYLGVSWKMVKGYSGFKGLVAGVPDFPAQTKFLGDRLVYGFTTEGCASTIEETSWKNMNSDHLPESKSEQIVKMKKNKYASSAGSPVLPMTNPPCLQIAPCP